jgi:Ca2+-binding RTX toxin-like protein
MIAQYPGGGPMSFDPEAVTQAGSGLVFVNYYDSTVSTAYRNAIITAEHELQSHFTNPTTINVSFDLTALAADTAARNGYATIPVSYATLTSALRSHATSSDDQLAVNGLPAADPSGGVGWSVTTAQARILGLASQTNADDIHVSLNSNLPWTFGQDAVGAIEHEVTEGGFGRVASLGLQASRWEPLDLFRFTAGGGRDYTGGSDGVTTYFGVDSLHVTALAYHSAISPTGVDDGQDLGDWESTVGDAFGPGGPGGPGSMSATDLRVLDVIGWNSIRFAPPSDEFASSVADTSHPFGTLTPGGSAAGVLQFAGDRDLFAVGLQAGAAYTINLAGQSGGGGTLGDPFLRIRDASGAVLASNDDIVAGTRPDSQIAFTAPTTGTFYVEAAGFADGYTGSYTVSVGTGVGGQASTGNDALQASATNPEVHGGPGDDTITGWTGADFLTGDDGDDVINGGPAFDRTNGNAGNDTIHGNGGGDWVTGGKDNDRLFGDDGDDILNGNLGADTGDGGAGNDTVRGGQGDDVLSGGTGDDYLAGDLGDDTLTGGPGADTFRAFAGGGHDVITDFKPGEGDRIGLDPGTTYTATQSGADVLLDLGGGAQTVLKDVQLAALTTGWVVPG